MFESDAGDSLESSVVVAGVAAPAEAGVVGARLRELLELSPVQRSTSEVASVDPKVLDDVGRVDLLVLLEQQVRWLESAKLATVAVMQERDGSRLRLAQEEIALALRVPVSTAQTLLRTAATVTQALPNTQSLLGLGKVSVRHAQLIAKKVWSMGPELAPALEAAVLQRAPHQSAPDFRRSLRYHELRLDPASAQERFQHAYADRGVFFTNAEDGMAEVVLRLAAADAQALFTRLTAATKLLPAADPRTIAQQRADLIVDAVLAGIPADGLPRLQGRAPSVQVVVSADTLLYLDDAPGYLTGYGPITADTARRIAADQSGTWRRLLTDPDSGQLLDVSQDRYRPSAPLRDFIAARDGVCAFSSCNQPAYRCEYDHILPYLQGGHTCRCNGALACRRHNQCKIGTGFDYQLNDDGSFTWTTPTGHEYLSYPPERWTTPDQPATPEQPERTLADVHAEQDRAATQLINALTVELHRARAHHDRRHTRRTKKALKQARKQYQRDLVNRPTEPELAEQPPF